MFTGFIESYREPLGMPWDVHKNGTQFETVDTLHQALFTSWRNIPETHAIARIEYATGSQRIFEIINKNGGGTHTLECSFFPHFTVSYYF